jgi:hypothetical protein
MNNTNETDAASWLFRFPSIKVIANDTMVLAVPIPKLANVSGESFNIDQTVKTTVEQVYKLFNQNEFFNPVCFNLNKAINSTIATNLPMESIQQSVVEVSGVNSTNQSCYIFSLDSRTL